MAKGQQREHEWPGSPVLAQGHGLVGLQPRAVGCDCGRDQQPTAQRLGGTIALGGLSNEAALAVAAVSKSAC